MAGVTGRIARACARHPGRTALAWVTALVAAVVAVTLWLPSALTTEARMTDDRDSLLGWELLDERLPDQWKQGSDVIVVRSEDREVTDAAYTAFLRRLVADVEATGEVADIRTPVGTDDPSLVSADGRAVLLPLTLSDDENLEESIEPVLDVVAGADGSDGFAVDITGLATQGSDFVSISERDLQKGELIGLPAALLILLLVFGALVAGALPLLLAIVCIPVTLGISALVGQAWSLSFFLVNMVTAMGLALGIDYSLFVVSRYREERRAGASPLDAVVASASTAGTAVLFSGLSFTVALSGLFLVPDTVLRSLAAGAVIVGIVTVAAALTLLPALLAKLGDRVDAARVPFVHSAVHAGESAEGRYWRRAVTAVMRRPGLSLAIASGVLLLAAVPVLGLQTGSSGLSSLPEDTVSRAGFVAMERSFPAAGRTDPARVVIDGATSDPEVAAAVERLERAVAADERFGQPRTETFPAADLTVVDVPLPGDPNGAPAERALHVLRDDVVAPAFAGTGLAAHVTGSTAFNVDYADLIADWLPVVIAFVLGLTVLLLTVVFRSVVLAAKAVLLNLLSVGAAYGLLVLVFQEGWGAGALGFTQVDSVEPWVPVFLFSVLFALSMDYHVFLLSRIREHHLRTGDTHEAVAHGISSTARLITGAAMIIVVVFAGFALGDLVGFQQMGFGVAVALFIDATLVRSVVVPASMALLGRWNWYLPRWLQWLPELQVEAHRVITLPDAAIPAPRAAAAKDAKDVSLRG